jgi:hypothetical protein
LAIDTIVALEFPSGDDFDHEQTSLVGSGHGMSHVTYAAAGCGCGGTDSRLLLLQW